MWVIIIGDLLGGGNSMTDAIATESIEWCIARCKDEPNNTWQIAEAQLAALSSRVELFDRLIALQRKRTLAASEAWQKAHNKPHTFPDLGELIDWLMG